MIYEFAFDELDLVQDEANNRKILKILGSGLSSGRVSGTVDNITKTLTLCHWRTAY